LKKNKYQHISDTELLNRFYADHDNECLGILLERYTMLLQGVSMNYIKKEEADKNSEQQVFINLINNLNKYKE
jgi:RNA polymerase sigma-70 factor (ECF subfamily)